MKFLFDRDLATVKFSFNLNPFKFFGNRSISDCEVTVIVEFFVKKPVVKKFPNLNVFPIIY